MSLRSNRRLRAFALLWVILALGAMGVLGLSLSVWVWIENQRASVRTVDTQMRFASLAVFRQVMGDVQYMLGPDTRVVEINPTGAYPVYACADWGPQELRDLKSLKVGVLGMADD
ncbi:MAG TPA: hypothetical protein PLV25_05045, partial [Opitutales bacterium]|nr:hypothetical protein [Opitutales bacterium]